MKYLGIDYGSKNVGIAVSDVDGILAFPKTVLDNDRSLLKNIKKIIEDDKIGAIVIGESLNFLGEPNTIMKKISPFKIVLEKETGLPVYFQTEFFTSKEADRVQGENLKGVRKQDRQKAKVRLEKNDASAAALILRSYLEKK
ncbi:MAG: Holliday junction resolvase RuvX [Candidatus Pacebacteria bacterium]|nr:Holliday junction resolvase RuvX [Candidatus Paceibacterota bacterium]